jgi:hypothetical protein
MLNAFIVIGLAYKLIVGTTKDVPIFDFPWN